MTNQLILTDDEFSRMFDIDLATIVASRLDDIADRVDVLLKEGRTEDARLLGKEGLEIAQCYDDDEMFVFLPDLRNMVSQNDN